MKNIKNGFIGPVIAVIVALVIAGGVYAIVDYKSKVVIPYYPVPTRSDGATSTAEVVVPTELNMYSDSKNNFTFKYPREWGNVVELPGNRANEESAQCDILGPGGESERYGGTVAHMTDTKLVFSSLQVPGMDTTSTTSAISITVLRFNDPVLRFCNGSYTRNLMDQWDRLQAQKNSISATDQGIEVYRISPNFSERDPHSLHVFFSNGLWVEVFTRHNFLTSDKNDFNRSDAIKDFNSVETLVKSFKFTK